MAYGAIGHEHNLAVQGTPGLELTAVCDTNPERVAAAKNLMLVVYQNRRYDADFVTMKRIIQEGVIGYVFQYDSFVGGYSEPCTYWHSNAEVSGGAIFDWGSHFIDQILGIIPDEIRTFQPEK